MNKKINLVLASILFGGVATVLPTLLKICMFVGIVLILFIQYDEWEYEQRVKGGVKNE
ncbi:hypothetical protein OEZ17_17440 [Enterococcus avium]|uniref:hypothetical protein n=1 Tax=Enterococcus avium TaxID=33945 RepID=UPI0025AEF0BA|nr:hypothetical protein [Enterococcus avium]MDN2639287.1 hypothetical protein [Enterococcus avium]